MWATGEPGGARQLIEGLRELHPDIPMVLTAPAIECSWVETGGSHRVAPMVGRPDSAGLATAIQGALGAPVA